MTNAAFQGGLVVNMVEMSFVQMVSSMTLRSHGVASFVKLRMD